MRRHDAALVISALCVRRALQRSSLRCSRAHADAPLNLFGDWPLRPPASRRMIEGPAFATQNRIVREMRGIGAKI